MGTQTLSKALKIVHNTNEPNNPAPFRGFLWHENAPILSLQI